MSYHLAVLLSGFSLVTTPVLAIAYLFFLPDMRKTGSSKAACVMILMALFALQGCHYLYLLTEFEPLASRTYLALLMFAPGTFFLFSRSVLFTDSAIAWPQLAHLAWVVLAFVLPAESVPTAAFIIGTAYTIWFARLVWGLRAHRAHFNQEMFFFALFAVMAVCALGFGLALPLIGAESFFHYYAISIGTAMALVVAAIIVFPELLGEIMLVSDLAYTRSKLEGIDVDAAQTNLEALIADPVVYQNENLNLALLAELASLTPHQLSELINSRYAMSFPRFIRERRVTAAREMLLAEPEASILSIGLTVGFKSQSSFYNAFKELTGYSPGAYRQQNSS